MSSPAAFEKPWIRGYWSLLATQVQGVFNDFFLKYLLIFLFLGAGFSLAARDTLVLVLSGLTLAPYVLFSLSGGFLADRFSKRTVTLAAKINELCVSILVLVGLALRSLPLLLVAVFLLSTVGALLWPAKYGLLPELLKKKRLSWGNGTLGCFTFVTIILAASAGSFAPDHMHVLFTWPGWMLVGASALGIATSFGIPPVAAAAPGKPFRLNPLADLADNWREVVRDRRLLLAVLGTAYFFFLGAILHFNIYFYGLDRLKIGETAGGYLLVAVAVGVAGGSLAAGYLSSSKIEYGLIPLGSIGMTAVVLSLASAHLGVRGVAARLALLGFFGGIFVVPMKAMVQYWPRDDHRGGVIALANVVSFLAVFAAAATYYLLHSLAGIAPERIFLYGGLLTALASVYVVRLLPESFVRLVLWVMTHTIYHIRVIGGENVPDRGGALFVSNHLSFVDAALLIASTGRRIRFVMFKDIYEHPIVYPFARAMRAIPISSALRPREMIHSLREASEAIKAGEIVCIFAEGQITRIGHLLPFRRGFARVMKGVDAPIIPVHLEGVWGSLFSFERGRFLWKVPRYIPYPVTVSFGKSLPPPATPFEVRQAVQDLGAEAFRHQRERMKPLHWGFVSSARSHPFRFAMADGRVPKLSFGSALTKTIFLARRLQRVWEGQLMVGMLLPPSVGGALANYAALMLGRVPVNLNYTASNEIIASCVQQCQIRTVLTTRVLLEKLPNLKVPGEAVFIEDLIVNPSIREKLAAMTMAWLLPTAVLERRLAGKNASLDDLATVIFSSGSTGDPKGVMLSHYNIGSNIRQVGQLFMLDGRDKVLGILPFFHSFGFTVTLWLPAVLSIGAVYHPNPLDATVIASLVEKYAVTLMVATPTFIQAYMRRCPPESFGSLQYVLVGAEKLPDRVALAFEDTFGIRALEGYGCTECAPVVAVNTRDFRSPGFRQVGVKRGRIGHPLPGITVRIVNPDTHQPVGLNEAGLLFVRGPNVMQGYLGRPDKTAEVLQQGWYNTGDVAILDEDGFLTISDRLSRFSKIGGEMIPHIKVEEKLHELAGASEQSFVVTSVPDEKRGERLVVLHTLPEDKLKPVLEGLADSELPALWKPRPNQFVRVDALPYLGTGKLDLRRARQIAGEFVRQQEGVAAP